MYRGRRAVSIENDQLRLTVLEEGGHIAELFHKPSGVNPLWTPPWPSIEPSTYRKDLHPEYGSDAESRLLAGLMGHNVCLDLFGPPSPQEAAAGLTVHGESSVVRYDVSATDTTIEQTAVLPGASLRFTRNLKMDGTVIDIHEVVENTAPTDRPIAWTQHVTIGPPFLELGATELAASVTRSRVYETDFTEGKGGLIPATDFRWPLAPRRDESVYDLRRFTEDPVSAAFTMHLMDPDREDAFVRVWSPRYQLALEYRWRSADFPWLGLWEENHSRESPPWNGETLARGLEFGVSPCPETRREMIERGTLFGVPSYRWIPAMSRVEVDYQIRLIPGAGIGSE